MQPHSPSQVYNTLLELYLHEYIHEKDISVSTRVESARLGQALARPPPRGARLFRLSSPQMTCASGDAAVFNAQRSCCESQSTPSPGSFLPQDKVEKERKTLEMLQNPDVSRETRDVWYSRVLHSTVSTRVQDAAFCPKLNTKNLGSIFHLGMKLLSQPGNQGKTEGASYTWVR